MFFKIGITWIVHHKDLVPFILKNCLTKTRLIMFIYNEAFCEKYRYLNQGKIYRGEMSHKCVNIIEDL